MQRVHYFQRFSKPEDVITNNTLLLLKRIQDHDPRLFQSVLQQIIAANDLVVGAELTQQQATENSIVDGVIRQRSFHVVIETKRHASFGAQQLRHHLGAFKGARADLEVLLLLGTQEPSNLAEVERSLVGFNKEHDRAVRLCWTTFAKLIEICLDIVPEHERETIALVDDYEDFCDGEGLLGGNAADLLVVGCSQSLPDNLELRLYYDPKRSHRPAKYIGFYKDKSVRGIGVLECVVRADLNGGEVVTSEGPELNEEQKERIREAMRRATKYGWNIEHGCYFFIAGDMKETHFRKDTKYPLWGRRYFDLRGLLKMGAKDRMPDLEGLANRLRDVTW